MANSNEAQTGRRDEREKTPPADLGSLSLDRLQAAFARLLEQPRPEPSPELDARETLAPEHQRHDVSDGETTGSINPLSVLEALLFVGAPDGQVLTGNQLAGAVAGSTSQEIAEFVAELNRCYESEGRPYEIVSEGAGYRMALRPEFHRLRNSFYGRTRQARLSQTAVDVLALVAYHESLTAEEITQLRGAACGSILSLLVRRQLLEVVREPGVRAARYRTTARFLELFGLRSLAELPRTEDMQSPPSRLQADSVSTGRQ